MEKIQDKKCENCRYFLQHYAKDNQSFHTVACGHCTNKKLDLNTRKKRTFNKACAFWETIEIRKAERKTAIKNILLSMAHRIEEISEILKEDELI